MKLFLIICVVLCLSPQVQPKKAYYLESKRWLNWFAAFEDCASRGLQFATVTSQEEKELLEKTIKNAGEDKSSFWLGGSDLAKEGRFVWMPTGERFNFTNWLPEQPDNNENNEHCVHTFPNWYNTQQWNDGPCDRNNNFICQDPPHTDIEIVCEAVNPDGTAFQVRSGPTN